MAIGEWVDNRETFYFQKLALSADVDSLAENDHRVLVQAGPTSLWTFDSSHPLWSGSEFGPVITITGADLIFTLAVVIWDRCPWNRVRISQFIDDNTPGDPTLDTIEIWRSLKDERVSAFTGTLLLDSNVGAEGWVDNRWNVLYVDDITGLEPGTYTYMVWWNNVTISLGSAMLTLESTVAGNVT